MNCPEWEERVAGGNPEAEEHVRDCPSCAALADGLARDARLLQTLPPEAFTVDYSAIRAAARKGAIRRSGRRKLLAVLAVAAAVLLSVKLPLHLAKLPLERQRPAQVAKVATPAPTVEARKAPAVSASVPKVKPRRRDSHADIDRRFAEFLRTQYALHHHADPRATEIATENPNVTILLIQESKGDANE